MNVCNFVGYITDDLKVKTMPNSKVSIIDFKIGVKSKGKKSTFVDLTAFGVMADNLCKYCGKGSPIAVTSHVREDFYTDSNGKTQRKYAFIVDSVDFFWNDKKDNDFAPDMNMADADWNN